MTVIDTNFLIDILKSKTDEATVDMIDNPKTTTVSAYELYYGARRSANPVKSFSEVTSLLKSIDLLEFNKSSALKAGDIQAELMNIGKPINILDVFIAAITITNKEVLLTRDLDHFSRIPGLRCRT